ncbi:lipase 3-like [Phlebotomus argentipes]|uniref:lipase 3-like n=1 Tax=Phlebotomus argentipes TaxID=94469 RepID=UPI0028929B44|nr:lipase 3-like [Phlebotomus argentipes]
MIVWYGYPVESHVAETKDGYLLTMHRIPFGRAPGAGPAPKKPVAFLQHGLLSSSADWLVIGPDNALAYLLADQGYDVWMGNVRGNTYSRAHKTLDPDNLADRPKFWDFSWHEIGIYDLPAMIDYVLHTTKQTKLTYAGHSQGTTSLFVMLSERPKYNNVLKSAHALAPVAFMKHLKSPFIKVLAPIVDVFDDLTSLIGVDEFLPSDDLLQMGGQVACMDGSPFQEVCANAVFLAMGYDSGQLNRTQLPAILHNVPAGASTEQLVHYIQLHNSGYFRQFDHGLLGNLKKYYSFSPPNYPLKKISAPIGLYYASNDWLANVTDVEKLRSQLPNVIEYYNVPLDRFNHIDFQWGTDVKSLVYDRLISNVRKYITSIWRIEMYTNDQRNPINPC